MTVHSLYKLSVTAVVNHRFTILISATYMKDLRHCFVTTSLACSAEYLLVCLNLILLLSFSRGFQEISWLPRSILFDIMFELYENDFKDRLFKGKYEMKLRNHN